VVAEFRRGSRRSAPDRRQEPGPPPAEGDRRRIRNRRGRRVADRRAPTGATAAPALPPEAAPHAARLVFGARIEPSDQEELDADTKRLVTRFQAGDEASFEEVYLRHFDTVYGYAHAALRNSHDAEDVAQQAFVRAFQALPGYEVRETPFRGWLLRIARNLALDSLRGRSRLVVEAPEEMASRQEARPGEFVRDVDWLSRREVASQVQRLPAAQREVIVLRYLLDLRDDEIADRIGGTVRAADHLHDQAIRILQSRL
jgi:RNA polymerase sigma-70 factor, ECF subfamily